MKRILVIVTSPFDSYGIGAVVRNYTDVLSHKFRFDFLLCAGADEVGEKYIKERKINIIDLKCSRLKNPLSYMNKLTRYLKQNDYDVVHAHGNSGTLFLEIHAAKLAGIKNRIAHCHNISCNFKFIHYLLKHQLNKDLTVALSCSKLADEWLFEKEGTVLNNAIPTSMYRFNATIREKVRREYNLQDSYVILNVGRLSIQKNQDFIIRLMPKVLLFLPKVRFLVVGDGERYDEYKELIARHNLESSVILVGKKDNVYEFYHAADCFVFPSVFEGLGLAIIEAQASGLKCIASNHVPKDANVCGKIRYLTLDEDNWVHEILQKQEIDRVLESANAIQKIKNMGYDIVTNAAQLEQIYNMNI